MIDCMWFNPVFNIIPVILQRLLQLSAAYFSRVFITSFPYIILYKPQAVFKHNHCVNTDQQWKWNDCHQSWKRNWLRCGFKSVTPSSQVTRHNSADSIPTPNLVCIKEVAIRTTFSHMINIAEIIYNTCSLVIDIQCTPITRGMPNGV